MPTPIQELVAELAELAAASAALGLAVERHTQAETALHHDIGVLLGEIRGQSAAQHATEAARAVMLATLVRWIDVLGSGLGQTRILVPLSTLAGAFGASIGAALLRYFGAI